MVGKEVNMLRKTSVYVILAAIIGVVIMLIPLTTIPGQQLIPSSQKIAPLPAKEYRQGAEEAKTTQAVVVKVETKQFNITQSIMPIILILALSLLPAFIISAYVKKRIS